MPALETFDDSACDDTGIIYGSDTTEEKVEERQAKRREPKKPKKRSRGKRSKKERNKLKAEFRLLKQLKSSDKSLMSEAQLKRYEELKELIKASKSDEGVREGKGVPKEKKATKQRRRPRDQNGDEEEDHVAQELLRRKELSYREAGQEEIKALFLPRCVDLAGADAGAEDLIDYVSAALEDLLTANAQSSGANGDELEKMATEAAVPYLSSFLEEDQATAIVKEVLQELSVGDDGSGQGLEQVEKEQTAQEEQEQHRKESQGGRAAEKEAAAAATAPKSTDDRQSNDAASGDRIYREEDGSRSHQHFMATVGAGSAASPPSPRTSRPAPAAAGSVPSPPSRRHHHRNARSASSSSSSSSSSCYCCSSLWSWPCGCCCGLCSCVGSRLYRPLQRRCSSSCSSSRARCRACCLAPTWGCAALQLVASTALAGFGAPRLLLNGWRGGAAWGVVGRDTQAVWFGSGPGGAGAVLGPASRCVAVKCASFWGSSCSVATGWMPVPGAPSCGHGCASCCLSCWQCCHLLSTPAKASAFVAHASLAAAVFPLLCCCYITTNLLCGGRDGDHDKGQGDGDGDGHNESESAAVTQQPIGAEEKERLRRENTKRKAARTKKNPIIKEQENKSPGKIGNDDKFAWSFDFTSDDFDNEVPSYAAFTDAALAKLKGASPRKREIGGCNQRRNKAHNSNGQGEDGSPRWSSSSWESGTNPLGVHGDDDEGDEENGDHRDEDGYVSCANSKTTRQRFPNYLYHHHDEDGYVSCANSKTTRQRFPNYLSTSRRDPSELLTSLNTKPLRVREAEEAARRAEAKMDDDEARKREAQAARKQTNFLSIFRGKTKKKSSQRQTPDLDEEEERHGRFRSGAKRSYSGRTLAERDATLSARSAEIQRQLEVDKQAHKQATFARPDYLAELTRHRQHKVEALMASPSSFSSASSSSVALVAQYGSSTRGHSASTMRQWQDAAAVRAAAFERTEQQERAAAAAAAATDRQEAAAVRGEAIRARLGVARESRRRHDEALVDSKARAKQRRNSTCPAKHGLERFRTPYDDFECSRCGKTFPRYTKLFGCRLCDFDLCESCFEPPASGSSSALLRSCSSGTEL